MSKEIGTTPESVELKDTDIIAKNLVYPTMHKVFEQWEDRLVPVQVTRDVNGKKDAFFEAWNNNQKYYDFNGDFDKKNSIAMRTGNGIGVVDVDTKDLSKLDDTWKHWVEERLSKKDTLIVETFNGYHIYINLKDFKMKSVVKEGKDKVAVPFIDFRGEGGVVFIASLTDKVSYEVLSDCELLEASSELLEQLPEKKEVEITKADDMDINSNDLHRTKSVNEVNNLLQLIPNNQDRTHWMEVIGSAYHAVAKEDIEEVVTLLKEWSKKDYDEFNEREFNYLINELKVGSYGANFGASKLIREALNSKVKKTITKIEKSSTIEDMESFLMSTTWLTKPLVYENDAVAKIVEAYQDKERELGSKATRSDTLRNKILAAKNKADEENILNQNEFKIVWDGQLYTIINNETETRLDGLSKGAVVDEMRRRTGISAKVVNETLDKLAETISETIYFTDYEMDKKVSFIIEPHPTDVIAYPILAVYINPLYNVSKMDFDMEIINDFTKNVWNGLFEKTIRLFAWTSRTNQKKNVIGLIAPPNIGKSNLLKPMNAPLTYVDPLVTALNGGKGLSKSVLDGMDTSSFLIVDEVDKPLPDEFKRFVDGVDITQFGSAGQRHIKVKALLLSAIHDTMFSHADKELIERCLCVKVEPKHSIIQSSIYEKNPTKYREHTEAFIKWSFKQEFLCDVNMQELRELQEKFKVTLQDEDVLEVVYEEVVVELIESCKNKEIGYGIHKSGKYCVKTKEAVTNAVETKLARYDLPNVKAKELDVVNRILIAGQKSSDRLTVNGCSHWETKININDDCELDFDF